MRPVQHLHSRLPPNTVEQHWVPRSPLSETRVSNSNRDKPKRTYIMLLYLLPAPVMHLFLQCQALYSYLLESERKPVGEVVHCEVKAMKSGSIG